MGLVHRLAQVMFRIGIDGGLAADLPQFPAQKRHIFPLGQLFAHRGLQLQLIQILIDGLNIPIA